MTKRPIGQILSDNLAEIMEDREMNQQRLAEKTGLSVSSVSEIVRGISSPKIETLDLIADALKVQAWELLVSEEEIRRRAIERSLGGPDKDPPIGKGAAHSRRKKTGRADQSCGP